MRCAFQNSECGERVAHRFEASRGGWLLKGLPMMLTGRILNFVFGIPGVDSLIYHPTLPRNAGTPERRNAGTPERRNAGTPERRNAGTPERRNAGTPERRNAGTPERRNAGTPERRNAGTPERRNAGTPERRNAGTPERRNAGTPHYCVRERGYEVRIMAARTGRFQTHL